VTDGGSSIRELCVALEHRWELDTPFLLFTAYFDESGTHGPNPYIVMAGFLGTARQWELVERKANALRQRYGFTVFHAKELRDSDGEFSNWLLQKKMQLVHDVGTIIRDRLTEGVIAILSNKDYQTHYRDTSFPKRMPIESQYGVCFRICLHYLLNRLTADNRKHKLHIVIESGHKNVQEAVRIFEGLKKEYEAEGIRVLGDITIAKKSERLPLMLADFQAHASFLNEAQMRRGKPSYMDLTEGQPIIPGKAFLTQFEITPEVLAGLKLEWRQLQNEQHAKRRAAQETKRIALASDEADGQL